MRNYIATCVYITLLLKYTWNELWIDFIFNGIWLYKISISLAFYFKSIEIKSKCLSSDFGKWYLHLLFCIARTLAAWCQSSWWGNDVSLGDNFFFTQIVFGKRINWCLASIFCIQKHPNRFNVINVTVLITSIRNLQIITALRGYELW